MQRERADTVTTEIEITRVPRGRSDIGKHKLLSGRLRDNSVRV